MRSVLARAAQDSTRLVDVQGAIFETPAMNDCFAQERTVAKNAAMTELRTEPPDASAAKITSIARPCHGIARGGSARFTETGHSNRANGPKPRPDIRCAPVLCLTSRTFPPFAYHEFSGLYRARFLAYRKSARSGQSLPFNSARRCSISLMA